MDKQFIAICGSLLILLDHNSCKTLNGNSGMENPFLSKWLSANVNLFQNVSVTVIH